MAAGREKGREGFILLVMSDVMWWVLLWGERCWRGGGYIEGRKEFGLVYIYIPSEGRAFSLSLNIDKESLYARQEGCFQAVIQGGMDLSMYNSITHVYRNLLPTAGKSHPDIEKGKKRKKKGGKTTFAIQHQHEEIPNTLN